MKRLVIILAFLTPAYIYAQKGINKEKQDSLYITEVEKNTAHQKYYMPSRFI